MQESQHGGRFYFEAINALERIKTGDMVLIDTHCEITPGSIVLMAESDLLVFADPAAAGECVGKVVTAYIQQ